MRRSRLSVHDPNRRAKEPSANITKGLPTQSRGCLQSGRVGTIMPPTAGPKIAKRLGAFMARIAGSEGHNTVRLPGPRRAHMISTGQHYGLPPGDAGHEQPRRFAILAGGRRQVGGPRSPWRDRTGVEEHPAN
jgi:hypothetical protein